MQAPEEEIVQRLKTVDGPALAQALQSAKNNALAFEAANAPALQALEQLEKALTPGDRAAVRDFTAARMRVNGIRYDAEARLNQNIANLYELQVRKANLSAEQAQATLARHGCRLRAALAACAQPSKGPQ